jgi:6-pyruvoyltetrahydropterin/6-carboxytetrahydropterin synthase
MEIFKTVHFEAAHRLPHVPGAHPCRRLHGHGYKLEIHVAGPVDAHMGWVLDFGDIRRALQPILEQLDHRCLNDVQGLENPTSENLVRWIWQRLKPALPQLCRLVLRETESSGCSYDGRG